MNHKSWSTMSSLYSDQLLSTVKLNRPMPLLASSFTDSTLPLSSSFLGEERGSVEFAKDLFTFSANQNPFDT
jgi:hypothetical protein